MATEWKPEATPPCCYAWTKIVRNFEWFTFAENNDFATMAYLQDTEDDDTKWRVNFCPACGKPARDATIKTADLFHLKQKPPAPSPAAANSD